MLTLNKCLAGKTNIKNVGLIARIITIILKLLKHNYAMKRSKFLRKQAAVSNQLLTDSLIKGIYRCIFLAFYAYTINRATYLTRTQLKIYIFDVNQR